MNILDLKKLAEVAGHKQQVREAGLWLMNWQPHIDIAQAFELIDALDPIILTISVEYDGQKFLQGCYEARLRLNIHTPSYSGLAGSRSDAICQAVLKATNAAQER